MKRNLLQIIAFLLLIPSIILPQSPAAPAASMLEKPIVSEKSAFAQFREKLATIAKVPYADAKTLWNWGKKKIAGHNITASETHKAQNILLDYGLPALTIILIVGFFFTEYKLLKKQAKKDAQEVYEEIAKNRKLMDEYNLLETSTEDKVTILNLVGPSLSQTEIVSLLFDALEKNNPTLIQTVSKFLKADPKHNISPSLLKQISYLNPNKGLSDRQSKYTPLAMELAVVHAGANPFLNDQINSSKTEYQNFTKKEQDAIDRAIHRLDQTRRDALYAFILATQEKQKQRTLPALPPEIQKEIASWIPSEIEEKLKKEATR